MTSTFSFGFAGDDIDIDDTEMNETHETHSDQNAGAGSTLPELIPAKKHDVAEWIPTLPSQISFNKLRLPTKTTPANQHLTLARRDIFDIRAQLMAEDTPDENNEELIAGLEKGDIKPNFYEGGFKTWECAVDLAKVLVDTDELAASTATGDRHIIELGAGTAIPSLSLFAQLLSQPASGQQQQNKRTHFTFADYNSAVLRLVTFPNLLLTWYHYTQSSPSPSEGEPKKEEEDELLDITPTLIQSFQDDISARGITISFISGAWSPAFVDLVFFSTQEVTYSQTLVLASETIYSPASLGAFSETLVALLRRAAAAPGGQQQSAAALVAAKKVYFGVGGGVDEFLAVLGGVAGTLGVEVDVQERLDVKSEGVGRVVLGVRCA
ncbi:protein-histidine N-methyltransferase [Aspergillus luchuensis]|uniref:protein-histidine N-methyltransferase n=1 Tax=Aspergillus kawachii TaxID=1069201 RepID=A0A146FTK6_ASPKA|nr:uncharacterized protein AKAW2_70696S [Aspergillus luchuensis]BCS03818.1 hypothetical protein AKAW2_70696S [Aspergillus luchuensis]BCS15433.1 hypothetical protein ALUC_70666S [Aspergillus luchuensis]GAA89364.1 hypothetical protein AKAW_07478 [Aspergillus luchuensis IFO 4308]GAT28976.1 hypothetical protein RIB2604_02701620 [Aspergillus luchuensis]